MKKLYVRFFDHKDKQIPVNSYFVCVDNCGNRERLKSIKSAADNISVWMREHTEGKTDFVWV